MLQILLTLKPCSWCRAGMRAFKSFEMKEGIMIAWTSFRGPHLTLLDVRHIQKTFRPIPQATENGCNEWYVPSHSDPLVHILCKDTYEFSAHQNVFHLMGCLCELRYYIVVYWLVYKCLYSGCFTTFDELSSSPCFDFSDPTTHILMFFLLHCTALRTT